MYLKNCKLHSYTISGGGLMLKLASADPANLDRISLGTQEIIELYV